MAALGHDDGVSAPARFGRYRVERRVGSGAFATVWLARDEELDSPVAVKVLADNWAHRLDIRERFEEEARILRRADSDRVVRVHDIGELEDGRPYFVMTYADGGTLADRLADGPLPVADALRYGADLARGLAVVHQVGVIHRDVNPRNVLLRTGRDGGERVLVADLGLAKEAARGSGFTLSVGTPGYMAPEQARPGEVPLDRRADVYAVGAVVHHMLTGVEPKQDEPSAPVRSLRPEVPEAVEAVVRQALASRPEDRFPSAGALADALDAAAVQSQVALPIPPGQAAARGQAPPPAGPVPAAGFVRDAGPGGERGLVDTGPTEKFEARSDDTLTMARPRARRRRGRRVALLVAALLMLAGAGTVAAVLVRDRSDVQVASADGTLRVSVPRSWAGQLQRSTWDLEPYGVTDRDGTALAVSPDVEGRKDPTSDVPGVFVGRVEDLTDPGVLRLSPAGGCTRSAPRSVTAPGLTGDSVRYECPGSSMVWEDAVLQPPDAAFVVYVQVKQPAGATVADGVLAGLRVSGAAAG